MGRAVSKILIKVSGQILKTMESEEAHNIYGYEHVRQHRAMEGHNMIRKYISREEWTAFAILFSVSAVLAYGYFCSVDRPNLGGRIELHSQILNGTAQSPYRYRVLVPFLTEILIKILSLFIPYSKAFLLSYAIYDLAAIFALLSILFIFFKQWFSKDSSLLGTLFVAGTMAIALKDHYFQPWSLLEVSFFSLSLLLIYRKWHRVLCIVILLAALNRETALFIPLAFLFTNIELRAILKTKATIDKRTMLLFVIYFLLWLIIFAGLRYFRGITVHIHTVGEIWARNTTASSLFRTLVNNGLFLGFFWIFAILGYRNAPKFIRKTAIIIPFYFLSIIVYGVWYEVRLLMPLYPILIPLGLSYVYHIKKPDVA